MEDLITGLLSVENERTEKVEDTDKLQHEVLALQHEAKLKEEYLINLESEINALRKILLTKEQV